MLVIVTVDDSGLCCIDKKLKQNDFQNLNVNLKERHRNDENVRLDSENCFASSFLSSSFLPSPFILFYPSSDTRRRPKVESRSCFSFSLCKVSTFLWSCSVLSASPAVVDSFRQKSVLR